MTNVKTYDTKEAADFLKIHPDTLKERVREGRIVAYRRGRKLVFLESDLLTYLKQNRCPTNVKTPRIGLPSSTHREAAERLERALGLSNGNDSVRERHEEALGLRRTRKKP